MTILGLGIDIIEISRIKMVITKSGDHLARRILRSNEWAIWETHRHPIRFLAKRFVAKEAAVKAFGTGVSDGLTLNQFEIFNDELGRPYLRLWDKALNLANKMGVAHLHITLTDERYYACAVVIIEN